MAYLGECNLLPASSSNGRLGSLREIAMNKMDRRMFLGTTIIGLAAAADAKDLLEPKPLTEAEWNAIAWGKAVGDMEAGLRLVRPKAAYRVGDRVELVGYLRNRSEKPVTFTYYPAFWEQTATVIDAAGERVFVSGITLLGIPTSVRLSLGGGETLILDLPGFWFGESDRSDRMVPYIDKSVPGPLQISQEVGLTTKADGRKVLESNGKLSTTPQVILTADRKPRRIQAEVVVSSQDELTPSLTTGEIKASLVKS
jgi:hypothetical protein